MKTYAHLWSKLYNQPLAVTHARHAELVAFLEHRSAGNVSIIPSEENEEPDEDDLEPDVIEDTAIIPIHGTLGTHLDLMDSLSGGCDLANVQRMIDAVEQDDDIKRVIYSFRTPGGEVVGLPETARKILNSSKETIGFFDSECCSGGMWLASQCQRLYGTQSARCGSIGVWCAYLDLSRQMQNEGENMQAFHAGRHKIMGAYWQPLTGQQKAIIQSQVDGIYEEFKAAVNAVRTVSETDMGDGLVFDGREAADRGLIDGLVEDISEILQVD